MLQFLDGRNLVADLLRVRWLGGHALDLFLVLRAGRERQEYDGQQDKKR